jgi:hypothetical protein
MKRQLEAYLLNQLTTPLPAVFCDVNKTGTVRRGFEYGGQKYRGSEDLFDWKDGKETLHIPRRTHPHHCHETCEISAPSSKMKQWQQQGLVLITGQDFETAAWDVYDIDGVRGYIPWPQARSSWQYDGGSLPPSEFDDCWLPIRGVRPGLIYFPFWLYQKAPIKGRQTGYESVVIDLAAVQQRAHEKLVASVY